MMIRWLLRVLTGLSFVLLVVTAALWVRSMFIQDILHSDNLKSASPRSQWRVSWFRGVVEFVHVRGPISFARPNRDDIWWTHPIDEPRRTGLTGPGGNQVISLFGASFHAGDFGSGPATPGKATPGRATPGRATPGASYIPYCVVVVPFWMLILLSIPVPLVRFVHWCRFHRRNRYGLCVNCGYDLRATPDRCPECGTLAAPGNLPAVRLSDTT